MYSDFGKDLMNKKIQFDTKLTRGKAGVVVDKDVNVGSGAPTNSSAIGFQASVASSNTVRLGNTNVTSIGGQISWSAASDIRLKKNIVNTKYGLNTVMKFRPVDYNLIDNDLKQVGFIAQEMKELVPEVITVIEGDLKKGETLGITYSNLVPVLTKAIQEQQVLIEKLQKANDTNAEQIKILTGLIEKLAKTKEN